MKGRKYQEIIKFCAELSFAQLKAFKKIYKPDKNREYMVASEVLKIKTRQFIEKMK